MSMTADEARAFEQRICSVTSQTGDGFSITSKGRVEILNDKILQVVGQPTSGGLPLGDAVPHLHSLELITKIIPL